MKKYVIYTSLTGGYDNLPQYDVVDDRFDYICFTNDFIAGDQVGQWLIKPIPINCSDNILLSRYAKIMPHMVLDEYEYCVWLDANLVITGTEIYDIVLQKIREGGRWYGIQHPHSDCIYEDAIKCLVSAKGTYRQIKPQIDFLLNEGFPKHYGLFENNFIIRKHHDRDVKNIDSEWWYLYNIFSRRDQLSLFYLFWKHDFSPSLILPEGIHTHNYQNINFIRHNPPTFIRRVRNFIVSRFNRLMVRFFIKI